VDVPWLRRLVAGLSPRRLGFDSGSVHVGFVVDEVAMVVLPITLCSSAYHFTNAPYSLIYDGRYINLAFVSVVK
jgi:hypothetical protein